MDLSNVQAHVTNPLPDLSASQFAAILGDAPSQYAKSPTIWNPTFRALDIDAVYLAFDVDAGSLPRLLDVLRDDPRYLGGNVTVPYKSAVMEHLDDVDPMARNIGAVNTIVRTDGHLTGFNTDGKGAVDSITGRAGGDALLPTLAGANVLLIGAGGAARATAFSLADVLGEGTLWIANRTAAGAEALAADVAAAYGNAQAIAEDGLAQIGPTVDLVVNASTRGQGGLRRVGDGFTCLEPFSSLAPAEPPVLPIGTEPDFFQEWLPLAADDIVANTAQSLQRVVRFPKAAFFDLVYFPLETVLLRHARLSGHPTQNGKWMNIAQAADAFVNRVCAAVVPGSDDPDVYRSVVSVMAEAW